MKNLFIQSGSKLLLLIAVFGIFAVSFKTKSNASVVVGVEQGGVPTATVPFNDLDSIINQVAVDSGYSSAWLIQQRIIPNDSFGFAFEYMYYIDEGADTFEYTTIFPVEQDGNSFIWYGGQTQLTCKSKNCNDCEPKGNSECTACSPDENETDYSCEKTIIKSGFKWEGVVSAIIAGLFAWLLND